MRINQDYPEEILIFGHEGTSEPSRVERTENGVVIKRKKKKGWETRGYLSSRPFLGSTEEQPSGPK